MNPPKPTDSRSPPLLTRYFANRVLRNMLWLYRLQGIVFLAPLAATPFLARVLGPTEWGAFAIAQSLALWSSLVVEYGFILSATREVARYSHNPHRLCRNVTEVHGAKLLLSVGIALFSIFAWRLTPALRDRPAHVFWAL